MSSAIVSSAITSFKLSASPSSSALGAFGTSTSASEQIGTGTFPLTTVFTPGSSCTSLTEYPDETTLFAGYDIGCFPPQWLDEFVYSPGICPHGYGTSATLNNGDFYTPIPTDASAFACCLSGYTVSSSADTVAGTQRICVSFLTTPTSIWSVDSATSHSVLTTAPRLSVTVVAQAINIMYATSDQSVLAAASSSAASKTTTVPPPPASSSPSSGGGGGSSGLSTGAKIGIGVAIPLAFIAFALALFLFFRRRGQRTRNAPTAYEPYAKQDPSAGGLAGPAAMSPAMSHAHTSQYGPSMSPHTTGNTYTNSPAAQYPSGGYYDASKGPDASYQHTGQSYVGGQYTGADYTGAGTAAPTGTDRSVSGVPEGQQYQHEMPAHTEAAEPVELPHAQH